MRIYKIKSEFGYWLMSMDASQASAPIRFSGLNPDLDWEQTPYQTADAQHSPQQAADLLAAYLGDEYGDLAEEIESVTEIEA